MKKRKKKIKKGGRAALRSAFLFFVRTGACARVILSLLPKIIGNYSLINRVAFYRGKCYNDGI